MSSVRNRFLDPVGIVDQLNLRKGMHVADFGCGTGHLLYAIAHAVLPEGHVYAVDIDEEMISSARAYLGRGDFSNVTFIQEDIVKSAIKDIPEESLDGVLMGNLLHVLGGEERLKAASNIVRKIKPGGVFVVIDWEKHKTLFGPPENVRIPKEEVVEIFKSVKMEHKSEIHAGMYHYGIVFAKPANKADKSTKA